MIPQIISIACVTEFQSPIISNMYHPDSQFDFITAFWADWCAHSALIAVVLMFVIDYFHSVHILKSMKTFAMEQNENAMTTVNWQASMNYDSVWWTRASASWASVERRQRRSAVHDIDGHFDALFWLATCCDLSNLPTNQRLLCFRVVELAYLLVACLLIKVFLCKIMGIVQENIGSNSKECKVAIFPIL